MPVRVPWTPTEKIEVELPGGPGTVSMSDSRISL